MKLKYVRRKGKTSWVCPSCKILKNQNDFSREGIYKNGTPRYYGFCKDCKSARAKETYQKDIKKCKERVSRYRDRNMAMCRLRQRCRMANITIEEYNILFGNHNGKCDICGVPQKEMSRAFCIDHDHQTGRVRGLLCDKCNKALGFLKDDINIVNCVLEYLKKFNGHD